MTPEERVEYNKVYYAEKKEAIKAKLFTKVQCDKCGRTVSFQNLPKHKHTSYCKNHSDDSVIEELKQEVEKLNQIIRSNTV